MSNVAGPTQPSPGAAGSGASGTIQYFATLLPTQARSRVVYPTLSINGYPVRVEPGPQPITVQAGRNRLDGAITVDGRLYSPASLEVDVPAGAVVNVYYRPRALTRRPGKMSLEPQRIYGRGTTVLAYTLGITFLIITVLLLIIVPIAMFSDPTR